MDNKEVKVCLSKSVNIASDILNSLTSDLKFSFSTLIDIKNTRYYVTNELEVNKLTTQVRKCIQNNIKIVNTQFLFDSNNSKSTLDPSTYLLYSPKEETVDFKVKESEMNRYELKVNPNLDPSRKREVKVFISSTFKDMQNERQELTKKIFPQLKYFCQQRNVDFSYVDLRWGITDESAQNCDIIKLCLTEIDNTRPYFIGILGEYYGWAQNAGNPIDPILEQNFDIASKTFPWITQFRDRSITELEMTYGALRPSLSPYLKESEKLYPRSFFYFRDPLMITRLFELGDPERDNYDDPSIDGSKKLSTLKEKIRTSKLPLYDGYSSFELFGELVLNDLKKAISIDFPETEIISNSRSTLSSSSSSLSSLSSLNSNAFYFHRLENEKIIFQYLENGVTPILNSKEKRKMKNSHFIAPLIIHASSGSGKSTLLQHCISSYHSNTANNSVFFSSHSSMQSQSFSQLMISIMKSLSKHFKLDAITIPNENDSEREFKYAFPQFLSAINYQIESKNSEYSKVVIFIDDLDLLSSDLLWIPTSLPSHIRFLATTNSTIPGVDGMMILNLDGLSKKEKELFTTQYLTSHSKKLNQNQMNLILQSKQTSSPLFLRSMLDELKSSATFESLNTLLQQFTNASSISQLFKSILLNWHSLFTNSTTPYFVKNILCLITASKNGLEEMEIREILDLPYSSNWSCFLSVLKDFCVLKNGLLSFSHPLFKNEIEELYLTSNHEKQKYHFLISKYFENQSNSPRKFTEYSYQLMCTSNTKQQLEKLVLFLLNDETLSYLHKYEKSSLLTFWRYVITNHYVDYNGDDNKKNENPRSINRSSSSSLLSSSLVDVYYHNFTKLQLPSLILMIRIFKKLALFNECVRLLNHPNLLSVLNNNNNNINNEERLKLSYFAEIYINLAEYENANNLISIATIMNPKILAIKALILKKQSNYQKSKELYNQAIEMVKESNGPNHPKLSTLLCYAADVDRKLGNNIQAIEQYNQSLRIVKLNYGINHPKVSELLNNLGLIAKKESNYSDALSYYNQSLSIILRNYGDKHILYANILNNIGDLHRKKGNYSEAISLYENALQIFKSTFGDVHPDIADVLNNLGIVYKKEGKYLEARPLFERSLSIIHSLFGNIHYKYALYLNNIADIERKTGNFDNAINLYNEALSINQQLLGSNHSEVAEVLNNLGMVYKKKALYNDAKSVYERAIQIIMNNFGALHLKIGLYLNNLADVYRKEKNFSRSLEIYKKALQVIQHSLGENHSEVAEIYQNIALILIAQKEFFDAKDYLEKSLLILRREFGDSNHPKIGFCFCKFGILELEQNQPTKAISSLSKSLNILTNSLGASHPEVGDVLVNLADVYVKSKQIQKAVSIYIQSLKIVHDSFGVSHYKYHEICEKITSLGAQIPSFDKSISEKKQKNRKLNNDTNLSNNSTSPKVASILFSQFMF